MNLGRLRRHCAEVIRDLNLPPTRNVHEICAHVARDRGRPIRVEAVHFSADAPCGLWIATADADYVFYESQTSPLHQQHIIAHELGHLLCGHEAGGDGPHHNKPVETPLGKLLPTIDPQTIARILGRSRYADAQEREAEMIATLLLHDTDERPSAPAPEAQASERRILEKVGRSLNDSCGGWA